MLPSPERRPELGLALVVAFVALILGSVGLRHLSKGVGETFGGVLWGVSHHGGISADRTIDGGFIITYTPSSWPALRSGLHWNDVFTAVDGRPVTEFPEVLDSKEPGDPIRYAFIEGNRWEGETYEVVLPAEEFTLDKLVESAGVYFLASLVFMVCGLVLVALPIRDDSRLPSLAGWTLIVAGVYELSGLRSTYATSLREVSLLGDMTWHLSFASAGTILILLASELALGPSMRKLVRQTWPLLLLISVGCAAYGMAYLVVDYGLGRWWLAEMAYGGIGGLALIGATIQSSLGLRHFVGVNNSRDYRSFVSVPFIVGALLIFLFLLFPAILGAGTFLPSQTVVPLVTMLPIGLLYSVLAARGMEERDRAARVAEDEAARAQSAALTTEVAMLRYRSEVSRFKGVLHNDILGGLQSIVRGLSEDGVSEQRDELGNRLQSLVRRIREEALTRLNAEQPMGDDFPSQLDVEKLVLECLNTEMAEIRIDPTLYQASEDIRKLLFVHLHTMLRNSYDHGRATWVSIELYCRDGLATLILSDNGSGFNVNVLENPPPAWSSGLREAIQVASVIGGKIRVESSPSGTTIREELPALPGT
jgi:hypothetical protein